MNWSNFFLSLILPVVFIAIGLFFWKNPPKEINDLAGWRTYRAMKSQETWDFANRLGGKCFFILGVVECVCTIVFLLIGALFFSSIEESGSITIVILIQAAFLSIVIAYVENKLKEKFYS